LTSLASIPYHDFGGGGPTIHFAHSNGYPPACFRKMMQHLIPHYQVLGMCQRPLWPGSHPEELTSWQMLADDMIRFLEQVELSQVIGIGHSSGAVATMYAALKRPDLFSCLVLIEPVFLPQEILQLLEAYPSAIHDVPVIQQAKNRRDCWPTRQDAFDRFRAKPIFEAWSDEALWDYVIHATHADESNNIVLTYSREWEVRVYSLVPSDIWELLPKLVHPVLAIRGAKTDALFPESWQSWQRIQPQATFVQFEQAGHMVPMERPQQLAKTILDFLRGQDVR
jgi:pimeloyl-ACP methyl ester carboxylesterase